MCCLTSQLDSQSHDLTESRTLLSVRPVSVCGSPRHKECAPFSLPFFPSQESLTTVVNDCTCLFLRSVFGDREEMYFIQKTKIMFL